MRCHACGSESPAGQRFCGSCGSSLEQTGAPAEERRLVTVLFADVTGSTALGEALDPEDVRTLFARYYAIAREVVLAHDGTLAKFIGDAVMAVFGLPRAHGDDAERALSAALDLRDRVRDDPKLADRLPLRLGVNTGEVVATREPSLGDFLITGDAVNVAARLEQAAEPWAILCGERTALAAAGAFRFGSPLEVLAKGKAAPLRAYPLLERGRSGRGQRVPLIGRAADLAQLELVARRAFDERRPFVVTLLAPAGTGKSRLLEEFLDRLPDLAPQATVAVAQCVPYGQRLTYGPLRPVLHRLAGIPDDAAPEVVRDSLRGWLREAGIESAERSAELLAATIGAGETEAPDRAALFSAWKIAVEAAARRAPLLLAFEDLHWSSESLLDLVEHVMQPRQDSPVLMVALARPEFLDRRPAWGGGRRNHVSLALEPLDEPAVGQLVEHLLGRRAPEIVAGVVARAEGNPFYAGEIVRSVLERLPSLDDPSAVERALATLPDTVQATVLARLDLLETRERRALQLGSVFGRAFHPRGLAALDGDLGSDASEIAERLQHKDLVRSANGDGYAFRHILIREVAYQTLPRAERWRLHAAAARWLEAGAAKREDALAELIAYHFLEAAMLGRGLDLQTDEIQDVRAKAVHWLTRSGEVAAAGAALGEAARHLRAAIDLADPEDLPELYERLARVSGGDESAEAHRTALALGRKAGRPADQELRVLAGLLVMVTRFQGSVARRPSEDEVRTWIAEGEALLPRVTDPRAIATFLAGLAFLPFWRSSAGTVASAEEAARAESSARRALELAESVDDARLMSAALDALTSVSQSRGEWEKVLPLLERRLALEERLDLSERLDAYSMLAWSHDLLGNLPEAERVSAEGLRHVQPGQAVPWTLHLTAWRLYALTLLGRWDEVGSTGDRACRLCREAQVSPAFAGRGFIAALDVARARGDERRVEELMAILKPTIRRIPAESSLALMLPYLTPDPAALAQVVPRLLRSHTPEYVERAISLCCDLGTPPAAPVTEDVVAFASERGFRPVEAQARRALGLLREDASELGRSLELFETSEAVPYAARARCERARLTGDAIELATGLKTLEDLGDREYLARAVRPPARPAAPA